MILDCFPWTRIAAERPCVYLTKAHLSRNSKPSDGTTWMPGAFTLVCSITCWGTDPDSNEFLQLTCNGLLLDVITDYLTQKAGAHPRSIRTLPDRDINKLYPREYN